MVLPTIQSYSQKRTGRSREDSRGGSGGNRNLDPGDSDHQGRGSDETLGSSARARGTSDARPLATDQQNIANNRSHVAKISKWHTHLCPTAGKSVES